MYSDDPTAIPAAPGHTPAGPAPDPASEAASEAAPETAPEPTPPSERMAPLIQLGVAHVFDTLTRQDFFPPTILAISDEGRRGMWARPDLTPEGAAEAVAALRPRPAQALAVFDGRVKTPEGTRPAVGLEAFEAGTLASVRLVQWYRVGGPGSPAEADGAPEVVANGPNPLT